MGLGLLHPELPCKWHSPEEGGGLGWENVGEFFNCWFHKSSAEVRITALKGLKYVSPGHRPGNRLDYLKP